MTALGFCRIYNNEPYEKLIWAKDCVGITFTKFDGFGRIVKMRFLYRQQALTAFDVFRFVAKYNIEKWVIKVVDQLPNELVDFATGVLEEVNRDGVLYRFTVDTAN